MRLWTISPQYLDAKGLVALWRESLLAKNVLLGNTKGYKNHPQLNRFKDSVSTLEAIDFYLHQIYLESISRNYKFDNSKFSEIELDFKLPVTTGQIEFEIQHLANKLKIREPKALEKLPTNFNNISLNPLFTVVPGEIEPWEIVK